MYFFLLFHLVQSDTVLLFFGATVTTQFPQGLIKSSESEHVNNTLSEQIVIEVRVWIMLPHVWMWNHNQRYKFSGDSLSQFPKKQTKKTNIYLDFRSLLEKLLATCNGSLIRTQFMVVTRHC